MIKEKFFGKVWTDYPTILPNLTEKMVLSSAKINDLGCSVDGAFSLLNENDKNC
ncbi:hypothetical protein MHBO_000802 [Bonamia ostreae]|uniref:Uncharacterized protein n=1 Tax=Bonamia ostreae TaxID=126728 RepID=A0ABV2AH37_9EUKA